MPSNAFAASTELTSLDLGSLLRVSASEFEAVASEAERQLRPADAGLLAQHLLVIVACCQRPPDQGDDQLDPWMAGLIASLQRHPGPVAIEAIRAWPQQPGGRWWPMAADLDALATQLGDGHAELRARLSQARAQRRARTAVQKSITPTGRCAEFVERVRASHGPKYVKSWLIGGVNATFGETAIWLTPFGAERLSRECGDIARELDLRLIADPDLSQSLTQYCDARGLEA